MVTPGLEKRFVDSIDYLRRMDFFQDYSNLPRGDFRKDLQGRNLLSD